jgi:hypothetical protein
MSRRAASRLLWAASAACSTAKFSMRSGEEVGPISPAAAGRGAAAARRGLLRGGASLGGDAAGVAVLAGLRVGATILILLLEQVDVLVFLAEADVHQR